MSRNSTTYPVRLPRCFWSSVGAGSDEIVVMLEPDFALGSSQDTRTFVIRGRLAVWWWSLMDGQPGHDSRCLAELASSATGHSLESLDDALGAFCQSLELAGLILQTATPEPAASQSGPVPVPGADEPLASPKTWCQHLALDAFVREDLVALGSFVGGMGNAASTFICGSNQGGEGDASAATVCRPGPGNGYFNAGWFGVPCGG